MKIQINYRRYPYSKKASTISYLQNFPGYILFLFVFLIPGFICLAAGKMSAGGTLCFIGFIASVVAFWRFMKIDTDEYAKKDLARSFCQKTHEAAAEVGKVIANQDDAMYNDFLGAIYEESNMFGTTDISYNQSEILGITLFYVMELYSIIQVEQKQNIIKIIIKKLKTNETSNLEELQNEIEKEFKETQVDSAQNI